MNRDPSDTNTNLPPWLRDQPLPPKPASQAGHAERAASWQAAPSDASAPSNAVPDWLSGASPAAPQQSETLPDWLRESAATSAPQAEETVPDWLRESAATSAPQAEETIPDWLRESAATPAPQAEEAVPDWLRESAAAPAPQAEEAVPDWLRESAATPAPQAEETVPDWLRESAATPAPQAEETVPDWLQGISEQAPEPSTRAAEPPLDRPEEVPDWLKAMAEQPEEPAPESSSWNVAAEPAQPTTPTLWDDPTPTAEQTGYATEKLDINDWLNDIPMDDVKAAMEGTDEEPTIEPFSFEGMGGSSTPAPQSGPPAWLGSDDSAGGTTDWFSASEQPARPQPNQPAEDLSDNDAPSWLSSATEDTASSDAPSWLSSATEDTASSDVPSWEAPSSLPPANDAASSGEDLPPWLQESIDDAEQSPLLASGTGTPSWLQEAPQPTEPGRDESVPSWLQEASQPTEPGRDESVPSWLQEASQPTEPGRDESVPSWLQASESALPIDTPPRQQPEPATPDWLESPAGASQPQGAPEVPDWLREAETASPQPMDETLPAWMRGVQAEPAAPAPKPAPAPEPAPKPAPEPLGGGQDLPPWLRDESGAPMPSASSPGEQDLPPWLKGATLDPEIESTLAAQAQQPAPDPQPAADPAQPAVGGWFDEPEPAAEPEQAESDSNFFGAADLPAWLRQPEQKATPEKVAESKALDWLTKLGSTEEEEQAPTPQAVVTTRFAPPPNPVKTESQLQAIALLERIARDPQPARAASQEEPKAPATRSILSVDRVLYLLLIAVLLAGALVPALTSQLQAPAADTKAQALHEQISKLGPNDVVLIGYDWDARRVAELRPLEQSVVGQLIEQKVKLVLVSTDPQGSLLLYDLRDKLSAAQYRPSGIDYLLLGYQPGGELALRSLAQNFGNTLNADFQGEDMTSSPLALGTSTGTNTPLTSLKNFSMIMLLADDQSDIQSWMEQIYQAAPDVPFATLMTAEAAPASEPYQRQPHVFGLVGAPGALAYAALRGDAQGTAAVETGQLRLGMIAFVSLLLVGAIVAAIVDATRRRKA